MPIIMMTGPTLLHCLCHKAIVVCELKLRYILHTRYIVMIWLVMTVI